MQSIIKLPNIKTPRVPNPMYKIQLPAVVDTSVNALVQQKFEQIRQTNIAGRTPTILTDPLLNTRVRDYYRREYERTFGSELLGRTVGTIEGAVAGANLAGSIVGTIAAIAALIEPTPFGEAAVAGTTALKAATKAGLSAAKIGAIAGATVGGIGGFAASDYSTWYATKDMFHNLFANKSIGRGILDSMYFVGQSMDTTSLSTINKSLVYSMITGENVGDIIARSYGLSDEVRKDMDFSLIREALGIDLGWFPNIIFDLTGEIISDPSAISGLVSAGSATTKGTRAINAVYVKEIAENSSKIISGKVLGTDVANALIQAIRNNNVDDVALALKNLKFVPGITVSKDLSKEVLQVFIDDINKAAYKHVGIRLMNAFKEIDAVDDFITHKLWVVGNPTIMAISTGKFLHKHKVPTKILSKVLGEETTYRFMKWLIGNNSVSSKIKSYVSRNIIEPYIRHNKEFFMTNITSDDGGFKKTIYNIYDFIDDDQDKEMIRTILRNNKITNFDMLDDFMKGNTEPHLKEVWDSAIKRIDEVHDEANNKIVELQAKATEALIARRNNPTEETIEAYDNIMKELDKLISSNEYNNNNFLYFMLHETVGARKVREYLKIIRRLQEKEKLMGSLNNEEQELLSNVFSKIVEDYANGDETVMTFFDQYKFGVENSGKINKSLREFIQKNINEDIENQISDLYTEQYTKFEKEAMEIFPEFKEQYVTQVFQHLLDERDSDPKVAKFLDEIMDDFAISEGDQDKFIKVITDILFGEKSEFSDSKIINPEHYSELEKFIFSTLKPNVDNDAIMLHLLYEGNSLVDIFKKLPKEELLPSIRKLQEKLSNFLSTHSHTILKLRHLGLDKKFNDFITSFIKLSSGASKSQLIDKEHLKFLASKLKNTNNTFLKNIDLDTDKLTYDDILVELKKYLGTENEELQTILYLKEVSQLPELFKYFETIPGYKDIKISNTKIKKLLHSSEYLTNVLKNVDELFSFKTMFRNINGSLFSKQFTKLIDLLSKSDKTTYRKSVIRYIYYLNRNKISSSSKGSLSSSDLLNHFYNKIQNFIQEEYSNPIKFNKNMDDVLKPIQDKLIELNKFRDRFSGIVELKAPSLPDEYVKALSPSKKLLMKRQNIIRNGISAMLNGLELDERGNIDLDSLKAAKEVALKEMRESDYSLYESIEDLSNKVFTALSEVIKINKANGKLARVIHSNLPDVLNYLHGVINFDTSYKAKALEQANIRINEIRNALGTGEIAEALNKIQSNKGVVFSKDLIDEVLDYKCKDPKLFSNGNLSKSEIRNLTKLRDKSKQFFTNPDPNSAGGAIKTVSDLINKELYNKTFSEEGFKKIDDAIKNFQLIQTKEAFEEILSKGSDDLVTIQDILNNKGVPTLTKTKDSLTDKLNDSYTKLDSYIKDHHKYNTTEQRAQLKKKQHDLLGNIRNSFNKFGAKYLREHGLENADDAQILAFIEAVNKGTVNTTALNHLKISNRFLYNKFVGTFYNGIPSDLRNLINEYNRYTACLDYIDNKLSGVAKKSAKELLDKFIDTEFIDSIPNNVQELISYTINDLGVMSIGNFNKSIIGDSDYIYDALKQYIEYRKALDVIENIEDNLGDIKSIYQATVEYINRSKEEATGFITNDLLDDALHDYFIKIGHSVNELHRFDSLSATNYQSGGSEKIDKLGNKFFADKKLLFALELAAVEQPHVFKPIIKKFKKFINDFNKTGSFGDNTEEFINFLTNLNDTNYAIIKLNRLGITTEFYIDMKDSKFKLSVNKNLPESFRDIFNSIFKYMSSSSKIDSQDVYEIFVRKFRTLLDDDAAIDAIKNSDIKTVNSFNSLFGTFKQKDLKSSKTVINAAGSLTGRLLFSKLDEAFPDLYSNGSKLSCIIRYSNNFNTIHDANVLGSSLSSLTDNDFVIFDSETTGETSHGVYSISATRIRFNKTTGKFEIISKKNFSVSSNYVTNNWTIDDAVDSLNASGAANAKGATLNKVKALEEDANVETFNSDAEMVEAFKKYLQSDASNTNPVLVAHNSQFDFGELMNAMSGGKCMSNGIIDNALADDFAINNFDFTVMDTALLQSYTNVFGKASGLTNVNLGEASKNNIVVHTFKKKIGNRVITTYYSNGKSLTEDEFNKLINESDNVIRYDRDIDNTLITATYNGKELHEAATDVELMDSWFIDGMNTLASLSTDKNVINLNSLDDSQTLINQLQNNDLDNSLLTSEYRGQLNKLISTTLTNENIDAEQYLTNRDLLYKLRENLQTLLDSSISFKTRIKAANEASLILSDLKTEFNNGNLNIDLSITKIKDLPADRVTKEMRDERINSLNNNTLDATRANSTVNSYYKFLRDHPKFDTEEEFNAYLNIVSYDSWGVTALNKNFSITNLPNITWEEYKNINWEDASNSIILKKWRNQLKQVRKEAKELKNSFDKSLVDAINNKGYIEEVNYSLYDLSNILDDYQQYRSAALSDMLSLKQDQVIGHLQTNKLYVSNQQAIIFNTSSAVRNLIDLFNNNKYGSLNDSKELKEFAETFYKIKDNPAFADAASEIFAIKDLLDGMDTAMTWFNDLYSGQLMNVKPEYYDTIYNVMKTIINCKHRGYSDNEITTEVYKLIDERSFTNKFDAITITDIANNILNNSDKLIIPDNNFINDLYTRINDVFKTLINKISSGENVSKDALGINLLEKQKAASQMFHSIVESAIEDLRIPLRAASTDNKVLKMSPFTAKEFNKMSQLSEDFVSSTVNNMNKSLGTTDFNFKTKGETIKFENGFHRMTPSEAVYWNSRYVPHFNDDYRASMSLKSKVNKINSDNFKPMDGYKNLPLVTAEEHRVTRLYTLAAEMLGVDVTNLVNKIYNTEVFNIFNDTDSYLYKQLMSLYDYLIGNSSFYSDNSDAVLSTISKTIPGFVNTEALKELGIDEFKFKLFVSEVNNISENTFSYLKDPEALKQQLICTAMYSLLFGDNSKISRESFANLIPESAKQTIHKIAYDPLKNSGFESSLQLFDDVKAQFTKVMDDGSLVYDVEGFKAFFQRHPEYTLAYLDENGRLIRLDKTSDDLINEILSSDDIPVTIMSEDLYKTMASDFNFEELPKLFQWLHKNILTPMKKLSLVNLNFIYQNVVSAMAQNTFSTEGSTNIFRAVKSTIKMARDYNKFQDLFINLTTSRTVINYINSSFYGMDKNWIEFLDNEDLIKSLENSVSEVDRALAKRIRSLSPEEIESYKFINKARNTSAARGEVNSLILNNKKEEIFMQDAENSRSWLGQHNPEILEKIDNKEKLNLSSYESESNYEEILLHTQNVRFRKYQLMTVEELKSELERLENIKYKTSTDKRCINIIKSTIKDKEGNIWDNIFKKVCIDKYLNFNENIETVIRLSAMKMYIEDGSTFDQATLKVIQRQFVYNDKSQAELMAEFLIPFISYPLRMLSLAETMTHDAKTMRLLFLFNKYSWGDEEYDHSDYLAKRKARGDIPVGNKLFNIPQPFNEGVMSMQDPLYTLNNKINPLFKPVIDVATNAKYNRWTQLPVISQVNNIANVFNERSIFANFTTDYYRYNNSHRRRIYHNNRYYGSFYKKFYTKSGYSRVLMNMQPLNAENLRYRTQSIIRYSGPTYTRR